MAPNLTYSFRNYKETKEPQAMKLHTLRTSSEATLWLNFSSLVLFWVKILQFCKKCPEMGQLTVAEVSLTFDHLWCLQRLSPYNHLPSTTSSRIFCSKKALRESLSVLYDREPTWTLYSSMTNERSRTHLVVSILAKLNDSHKPETPVKLV